MNKLFAHRSVICFYIVITLLFSNIFKLTTICTKQYDLVQIEQSQYRVTVSNLRGTIYDCNMTPLTNNVMEYTAAILPTPDAITMLSEKLNNQDFEDAVESLRKNKPTICVVPKKISNDSITTTAVYRKDKSNSTACHILGYTDSSGHGVSGLEYAYDDLLYSGETLTAVFATNGKGEAICGIRPYFENDFSVLDNGVVSTIDVNIQNIAEQSAQKLNSGCIIVAEASNAKIRALVSVPTFNIENLSGSLNDDAFPLVNRALTAYSVGSVFKPCVAAAALEKNLGSYSFECIGGLKIGDRIFKCHNTSGHGVMNLESALAQSCNCFFYDFAISLGGSSIYKMASSLNFGMHLCLADNIYTAKGNLPKSSTLATDAAVANLSIGQGELLVSPVSMLPLYCAIATDGSYYVPSLVEKTLKDGEETQYNIGSPTKVMSSYTASILRKYLQTVITDGTGSEAKPKCCDAAGKTATAQTGRYYDNGVEITNSWFCGFFPADNPQYVVIVMSDGKLNVSTASIFAEIADGITELTG